jgi:hypothetical protein
LVFGGRMMMSARDRSQVAKSEWMIPANSPEKASTIIPQNASAMTAAR